ncbi:hypothetical protein, partial [Escherichia coli]|uniref:hypothetical protein n=1 Tax=Escherichia coli TaxID=562 RepID=UPI001BDD54CB
YLVKKITGDPIHWCSLGSWFASVYKSQLAETFGKQLICLLINCDFILHFTLITDFKFTDL